MLLCRMFNKPVDFITLSVGVRWKCLSSVHLHRLLSSSPTDVAISPFRRHQSCFIPHLTQTPSQTAETVDSELRYHPPVSNVTVH